MSNRLSDMVRTIDQRHRLVVTEPHSEWMERDESLQVYSDEAIEFVGKALRNEFKRPRAGRLSPSALGKCPRRVAFGFAGLDEEKWEANSLEIVDAGTWAHLKWQAEGLTMGYLSEAEHWVEDPSLYVGGSLDGVLHEHSVFELKSAAPSVFSRQVLDQQQPHAEYEVQTTAYMMLFGASHASMVYEDRAYGNFHEFRIEMTHEKEKAVINSLRALKSMIDNDELPPMYEDCTLRIGKVYRSCPFRKVCHKYTTVSQAYQAGGSKEFYDWSGA